MKCQRGARPAGAAAFAFGTSSCARFSPKSARPASSASRIASTGCVFVTPTIVTSAGSRPARSQACAMFARTSARRPAMVAVAVAVMVRGYGLAGEEG